MVNPWFHSGNFQHFTCSQLALRTYCTSWFSKAENFWITCKDLWKAFHFSIAATKLILHKPAVVFTYIILSSRQNVLADIFDIQQNSMTARGHTMRYSHKYFKTCLNERLWYIHLWAGGLSYRSIAKMTGRSATTVRKWVIRLLNENRLICVWNWWKHSS